MSTLEDFITVAEQVKAGHCYYGSLTDDERNAADILIEQNVVRQIYQGPMGLMGCGKLVPVD